MHKKIIDNKLYLNQTINQKISEDLKRSAEKNIERLNLLDHIKDISNKEHIKISSK